jgi:hypothetical protein
LNSGWYFKTGGTVIEIKVDRKNVLANFVNLFLPLDQAPLSK